MGLDRYLIRQLLAATLIAVVAVTCVIWLSQSLRFIDLIVNRGLSVATFVYLTVLLLPTWLAVVLPITVFAATLFVYNRLAHDHELVVLAAAGLSPFRLARPALLLALCAAAICYVMTLYLIPVSYRAFKELQFQIRHTITDVLLQEGVFNSVGRGLTVYLRSRHADGELRGVVLHDSRDPLTSVTLIAERGALTIDEDGPRVFMVNGSRQVRNHDTGSMTLLYFDRYSVRLANMAEAAQRHFRDLNELFLPDLLYPSAAVTNPRNFRKFIAEGHSRLTTPLLAIGLCGLALAVLLHGEMFQRRQSHRMLVAVVLACAVEALGLGCKYLAAKQPGITPLMYAAVLLPIALSLLVLLRQRLARPAGAPPAMPGAAPAAG